VNKLRILSWCSRDSASSDNIIWPVKRVFRDFLFSFYDCTLHIKPQELITGRTVSVPISTPTATTEKLQRYAFLSCRLAFNFINIIIIISHQLGLDRPVSASSNSLIKGLPSHLRQFGLQFSIISGILLLFILSNVVENFICIFLVSCHLVLLSTFPNYFVPFVVKEGVPGCSSEKFHLDWCQDFLYLAFNFCILI